MPRLIPVAVPVALVLACGEPSAGEGSESAGADPRVAASAAWSLVEDLRIGGSVDGGPDEFGFIAALDVDAGGRIYVADGIAQEIRVFAPDGTHVVTFGGAGDGPGELGGIGEVTIAPNGAIWVTDLRLARYSVFSPAGEFLTSHPRRLRGSVPGGAAFDGEGRLIDWGMSFPRETPEVVAGSELSFDPVRYSADFTRRDTLPSLVFDVRMVPDGSRPQVFQGGGPVVYQDGAGATWFAYSPEYTLRRRDTTGDTLLVISRDDPPVPVGEPERAEVRERMASRPDLIEGHLEGLPATKPVIRHIFGDGAGHIYVIPELAGVPAGSAVDVFTTEGAYLGRLALPRTVRRGTSPIATSSHLYAVVFDDLDIPSISRMRIER